MGRYRLFAFARPKKELWGALTRAARRNSSPAHSLYEMPRREIPVLCALPRIFSSAMRRQCQKFGRGANLMIFRIYICAINLNTGCTVGAFLVLILSPFLVIMLGPFLVPKIGPFTLFCINKY